MSNKRWTTYEKQFIIDNAGKMTDEMIAQELTRQAVEIKSQRKYTLKSVRIMRQKLGLKKMNGRGVCRLDTNHLNL